ncbi:MAG: dTDP-4-dehydrorhamnose reductase [candidate division KSB1 bacterium]|nr:dTDP-4-dehydrorhamnose reductase [candidate division KSB1 bacterium]
MKVLLTGCHGLLGQRLVALRPDFIELVAVDLADTPLFISPAIYRACDLTQSEQVCRLFEDTAPDWVIHTAAYTNVDRAEDEPELCRAVNVKAVEYLVRECCRFGATLVQLSTDYVFDGTSGPYDENARPNPLGVYAKSKWEAEEIIKASGVDFIIARTMVLYGRTLNHRPEFVGWLIDKLRRGERVRIVTDQYGNATLNDELAAALWRLTQLPFRGILHLAGRDVLSRYEFSLKIADCFDLDAGLITPVTTAELGQKAPRPLRSGLIVKKAVEELGLEFSDTAGGLLKYKAQWNKENQSTTEMK